MNLSKPKNNLPPAEREVLKALKYAEQINPRKPDKGTNTVVMNKEEKLREGQIQLNVTVHYRLLESPMVEETGKRVLNLINEPYQLQGDFIDEMTTIWVCQTTTRPPIPIFYTLTKIYLQTHGTAMSTKMAVASFNILIGDIERQILQ